jgi:rhodanese-related sulfurtransferase
LICPTGRRSLTAAKIMMENGFEKVFNLKGGTVEWIRKGFKVSKGNE